MSKDIHNCSGYRDIRLNDLENIFSSNALNMFDNYQIMTLGDLFDNYESGYIFKLFQDKQTTFIIGLKNEIYGTIKILKYKYLDEALDINLQPELIDIQTDFGFSSRVVNALIRNKDIKTITVSDLFSMAEKKDFSKLFSLRGVGAQSVNEIIVKVTLFYECYRRMKNGLINYSKENCDSSSKEITTLLSELQNLSLELKRVIEEEKQIAERIDEVQEEIRQKILHI